MMSINSGKRIRLSLPRRFVVDLLHFAKKVPSVPMQRRMKLNDVVRARTSHTNRISWSAIFLKAYSIVAANRPELRRSYMPYYFVFPWPHLYEHPINIAMFSIERNFRGDAAVFPVPVPRPELRSLCKLDELVRLHKSIPIEEVRSFQSVLRLSRLPLPLRRLVWWLGLNVDGMRRAKYFGTFGVSVVASLGAAGLHILSPLTTTLNYGTFEPDGSLDVRVVYDHRVIDGANMARLMAELEDALHGPILSELLARVTRIASYFSIKLRRIPSRLSVERQAR